MSTSRDTLDLWRMDDHYASRETTVQHMFALCEQLWLRGEQVPRVLGFRMSPLGIDDPNHWPDAEYGERMDDGSLSPDEARRALLLLQRYLRFLPREE